MTPSDFDFWLGTWRGTSPASPGTPPGAAVSTITGALGGAVIHEHFVADGDAAFEGLSMSVYGAAEDVWNQTWVDNAGGYLDFVGGRSSDEAEFHRSQPTADVTLHQRMVFSDIEADSFEWRWQRSSDRAVWETVWPISYTRLA